MKLKLIDPFFQTKRRIKTENKVISNQMVMVIKTGSGQRLLIRMKMESGGCLRILRNKSIQNQVNRKLKVTLTQTHTQEIDLSNLDFY